MWQVSEYIVDDLLHELRRQWPHVEFFSYRDGLNYHIDFSCVCDSLSERLLMGAIDSFITGFKRGLIYYHV